jgi:hypothetical protein
MKVTHAPTKALLRIIESSKPFEILTSDIAGEFPETLNGNKWILIIIDNFTKFAQAYAMPDATVITVATNIVDFMLTYGISDQIHTDQGTNFQSELLQHIYDFLDVYKTRTTAYHPEADGNSEVFIR